MKFLLALFVLGLATACSSTPGREGVEYERPVYVWVDRPTGSGIDGTAAQQHFVRELGSRSGGQVRSSKSSATCLIHSEIVTAHGGMGTMLTLRVAVQRVADDAWLASKEFHWVEALGAVNRDVVVSALITKSSSFVVKTARRAC